MEGGLRIETTIGLNGHTNDLLRFLTGQPPSIIYAVGGLLVREELGSKRQVVQKVHNGKITTLGVSPDGRPG